MCQDAPQTIPGREYEHSPIKPSQRAISTIRSLFVFFVLTVNYSPMLVWNNAKWLCFFSKYHLNTDRAVAVKTITQIYTKQQMHVSSQNNAYVHFL